MLDMDHYSSRVGFRCRPMQAAALGAAIAACLALPGQALAAPIGVSWAQLSVTTAAALAAERIDERIYRAISENEVVVQDRPTAPELSGVHVAAIAGIEAETKIIWDVLIDCKLQTTFMPDFAECREVDSTASLLPNEKLLYNRFNPQVALFELNFEFIVRDRFDPPRQMWWQRISGDMRINQGYWKLIPVDGMHHVVILDSTVDPGAVPEFIQRAVARGNMPDSVRALKEYIEQGKKK